MNLSSGIILKTNANRHSTVTRPADDPVGKIENQKKKKQQLCLEKRIENI